MSSIRILPERVASQIAAGEVIERPASVARELIDNSIDAGADRISVQIGAGGKRLVKVSDNGGGMSRDDMLLSVERHATSKIESIADLFSIKTLGFRGEALPSIASVSRMELVSRPSEELIGHRLRIAGGRFINIEETGAAPGTVVEVRDLFFNLPARRKFLRSAGTETDHIVDLVTRVSLPFPGISFILKEAERVILNLPSTDLLRARFSSLMGREVAESMIEVHEKTPELEIEAYLAPSEFNRSRGDRLFVYVNGRNVRDRLVNRAILEGFAQRLMKGRYPQAVVFLDMDPAKVDVNVHPTKQEVRFRSAQEVFQRVVSALEKGMALPFRAVISSKRTSEESSGLRERGLSSVSESLWTYKKGIAEEAPDSPESPGLTKAFEHPRVVGQLGNTYILCETSDALLMIDQHAAHERVVYERLRRGFEGSRMEIQTLLIPLTLELSAKEGRIMLEKRDQIARLGIEVDHFGGNTFLLRAVPTLLKETRWAPFLSELITTLEKGSLEDGAILDRALTVMACHGAIRAGQALSLQEMNHLIHELEETDLPSNCPHGRPVFKGLTYHELQKMFKRII
jgi:DNA mismatch repair protein MutL